jgi:hypothetical protein
MIQRIQSLYLFLTTLLSLLFLKGGIIIFSEKSGSVIKVTFNGLLSNTGGHAFEHIENLLPLSVLIILIPVVSLITIFCFKSRKLQLLLSLSVIILAAGLIVVSAYYSWHVFSEYKAGIIPGFKIILPVVILILSILAYRGILKDDRLVKSYDRLR